jgi:hypothetical protein
VKYQRVTRSFTTVYEDGIRTKDLAKQALKRKAVHFLHDYYPGDYGLRPSNGGHTDLPSADFDRISALIKDTFTTVGRLRLIHSEYSGQQYVLCDSKSGRQDYVAFVPPPAYLAEGCSISSYRPNVKDNWYGKVVALFSFAAKSSHGKNAGKWFSYECAMIETLFHVQVPRGGAGSLHERLMQTGPPGVGTRLFYQTTKVGPVHYVVPKMMILGRVPLIPALDGGEIPKDDGNAVRLNPRWFPQGERGSPMFFLHTWAMCWPSDTRRQHAGSDPRSDEVGT